MSRFIEWDPAKAESNYRKHGVRFEVAARAFDDPLAVSTQDRFENGEARWQTLGRVEGLVLLLVAHTARDDEDGAEVIRIISARRPTKQEKQRYEND